MQLIFADEAWEDYAYWQKQDKKMIERINKLISEVQRDPFAGVRKPEPLKHALSGFWSRRINDEHRMGLQNRTRRATSCSASTSLLRRSTLDVIGVSVAVRSTMQGNIPSRSEMGSSLPYCT